jgi:hypothetical protein
MSDNIENFKKNNYCKVESIVSVELRDFITQYALFDEMQNYNPEEFDPNNVTVPDAHSQYADPAMETMLLYLHPLIEEYTDLSLFPTYSYFRVYRYGDELEEHVDRPSCEISATVCFNYSYDSSYQWPIFMNESEVILNPGDMVIYKGCELPHYRKKFDPPGEDDWQVQGFFHYVNASGPYTKFKYDERSSIGELKNKKTRNSLPHYIRYT